MASIPTHGLTLGLAAPFFEPITHERWLARAHADDLPLMHAAMSVAGPVRPHNEDRWEAVPHAHLFVVADGMGGYNAGEIAAELAVQTACRLIPQLAASDTDIPAIMNRALGAGNDQVRKHAARNPDCLGMGTTIVCCLIRGALMHVAHIGDSRAYLLRGGLLRRMTRDHSIGQQVADAGVLTPAQVRHLPGRGILTRALGIEASVTCDFGAFEWQPADTLLLCSDGLTDPVADERIEQLLVACASVGPEAQVKALVDAALQAGGSDNITALVVRAADAAPERDDKGR